MEKIKLYIIGIEYTHSHGSAYALVLAEAEGKRRLPIIIGIAEAQAIAIELERMKAIRPLTHDLFKSFADAFDIQLKEVIINKYKEGIFHSLMSFSNSVEDKHLDARTSDAVAIALRFNAPIYTYEEVLKEAGMMFESDTSNNTEEEIADEHSEYDDSTIDNRIDFSKLNVSELEELLNKAIEEEDFERASRLRDEIENRRKSSK